MGRDPSIIIVSSWSLIAHCEYSFGHYKHNLHVCLLDLYTFFIVFYQKKNASCCKLYLSPSLREGGGGGIY